MTPRAAGPGYFVIKVTEVTRQCVTHLKPQAAQWSFHIAALLHVTTNILDAFLQLRYCFFLWDAAMVTAISRGVFVKKLEDFELSIPVSAQDMDDILCN